MCAAFRARFSPAWPGYIRPNTSRSRPRPRPRPRSTSRIKRRKAERSLLTEWRMLIQRRQPVAQLGALGLQILSVVLVAGRNDRDLVDHFQIEAAVDEGVGF